MSNQLAESTREEVLRRDGLECRFCEITQEEHREKNNGRGLSIHHLIKRRAGGSNDPENLITVCNSCHQTLESTQGDALERIQEKQMDKEKIQEQENKIEKLESKIKTQRDTNENLSRELNFLETVIANILCSCVTTEFYITHESGAGSNINYVGKDIEQAESIFKSSNENTVKMERHTLESPITDINNTFDNELVEQLITEYLSPHKNAHPDNLADNVHHGVEGLLKDIHEQY